MNKKKYQAKLKQFNSTEKYMNEVYYMTAKMDLYKGEKALDYGCGIGTMVDYLLTNTEALIRGYDRFIYFDSEPFWFNSSFHFQFDVVYFMHSIAHIEQLDKKLITLKELLKPGGEVYVLTPNKEWLDKQDKTNYKPDPTVVQHYDADSLTKVFVECDYAVIEASTINDGERLFLKAEL